MDNSLKIEPETTPTQERAGARRPARRRVPMKLIFREARATSELTELLRLRCAAFQASRVAVLEPQNPRGFNLDAWDPYARHFGLFLESAGDDEPIGYHRLVGARSYPDLRILDLVHASSVDEGVAQRSTPLPLMSYWPEAVEIAQAYRERAGTGVRLVEGSRFSVRPDHRSPRTMLTLLQAQMANVGWVRNETVWITCTSNHLRFYERLGFRRVPGTTTLNLLDAGGENCCCIEGKREWIPESSHDHLASLAREMAETGQIVQRVKLKRRAA